MVQMNSTKKRGVTRALGTGEERSAEALTVLWMLTAVACLAAQIVAAGTRALLVWSAAGRQIIGPMVPGWFSFCALVTATICLGLTPLVWYVRRQKPPLSVLLAVLVISLVPWAMVVFQMF